MSHELSRGGRCLDLSRAIDEPVPRLAAEGDDAVVALEVSVGEWSRKCSQTFPAGLSSGDRGGSGMMLMLCGRTSAFEICQPAGSRSEEDQELLQWIDSSTNDGVELPARRLR